MSAKIGAIRLLLFTGTHSAGNLSYGIFPILKILIFFGLLAIMSSSFANGLRDSIQLDVHGKIPEKIVTTCETNLPPIAVNVSIQESPVEETNDVTVRSLTNIALKLNNPHVKDHYVLGLTTIELSWHANAQYKSYQFTNPSIRCARSEMKIDLIMLYHKVQIAKEISPGTCEYDFVRKHEYRHVKLDEENVKSYAREIKREFQDHFESKIYYGSSGAVEKAVRNEIDNNWLPFVSRTAKTLEKEGTDRQKLIDTPEEYAKGNVACSGNIARLLNRYYGKQEQKK